MFVAKSWVVWRVVELKREEVKVEGWRGSMIVCVGDITRHGGGAKFPMLRWIWKGVLEEAVEKWEARWGEREGAVELRDEKEVARGSSVESIESDEIE